MSGSSTAYHVLFVDDERYVFEVISRHLRRLRPNWAVTFTDSAERALELIDQCGFDAVVTDFRMPGTDGLQMLNVIRREQYPCAVIMLTGAGCQATAVRALKSGAQDYLVKGSTSPREIVDAIENAIHDQLQTWEGAQHAEPAAAAPGDDRADGAHLDATTSLLNRAAFDASLQNLESFLQLTGESFALLRIDIDGFRPLCALDGIEIGDEALRHTASVIHQATRSGDLVARSHDDVFLVLAIGLDGDGALRMSARIHDGMRRAAIPQPADGLGPSLTVSIGIIVGAAGDSDAALPRTEAAIQDARRDGPARTSINIDDHSPGRHAA